MPSNVEVVQAVYAAVNAADVEGILEAMDPAVEWRGPKAFPDLAEPHRGHEGVRRYASRVAESWREFGVEPERFIELEDDRVLVLTRERGRGRESGAEVRSHPSAHLWTLRGGKVLRFQVYWERAEAFAALGLEPPGG